MAAAPKNVELPTEVEYQEVLDKLQAAYDALEALTWRLVPLDGVPSPKADVPGATRPVTLADVGLLWSFLDSTELQLGQLNENRRRLLPILGCLDQLRCEEGVV